MTKNHSKLLLDDELDIITTTKAFLQKRGLYVYGFIDPYLALEHFQLNGTANDLVISEIRMPQMNGYEFIKKVKEIKPEVKVFLRIHLDSMQAQKVVKSYFKIVPLGRPRKIYE